MGRDAAPSGGRTREATNPPLGRRPSATVGSGSAAAAAAAAVTAAAARRWHVLGGGKGESPAVDDSGEHVDCTHARCTVRGVSGLSATTAPPTPTDTADTDVAAAAAAAAA